MRKACRVSRPILMALETAGLLLFLMVTSAGIASAQPGEQRKPEQIRRQLEEKLEQQIEYIGQYPDHSGGYLARGEVYAELSWRSKDENERAFFAERALHDYAMAIQLEPHYYRPYVARAQLRYVEFLANFDDILADYLMAVRLLEKAYPQDGRSQRPDDSPLPEVFNAISGLYLNRAEALLRNPQLLASLDLRFKEYSPWQDFDSAISYAQKSAQKPVDLWNVINALLRKGDAAYQGREYAVALAAYQSDTRYLGKDYKLLCVNALSKEWCERNQRQMTLTFSIRRGRAYLKLKQPERALAEFNVYFAAAYHLECLDIFLLRAQAHWALGNDEQALTDEESAKKAGTAPCPFDIQK
ncbi:MAG: hypothetical protein ACRD9S_02325 [Pyrinomonadaceae bacterium]